MGIEKSLASTARDFSDLSHMTSNKAGILRRPLVADY
jgi:hypothetical protein